MNEDFKFTPNAAKLLADIELDSALAKQRRAEMRAAGVSEEEIIASATAEADDFKWLLKGSKVVNLLVDMGTVFGMGRNGEEQTQGEEPVPMKEWKNQAFVCCAAGMRALVDSPLYKRWDAMFTFATTIEAVWIYFMQENLLTGDDLKNLPGFDVDFFMSMLKTPLDQETIFALNADDDARIRADRRRIAP